MLSRVQSGLSQMWRFVIFLVESVQRHTYSKLLAICSFDFMVFNNSWLYYSDVNYPQKCKQRITPVSINSWHFSWHFWCFKSLFLCVFKCLWVWINNDLSDLTIWLFKNKLVANVCDEKMLQRSGVHQSLSEALLINVVWLYWRICFPLVSVWGIKNNKNINLLGRKILFLLAFTGIHVKKDK